MRCTVRSEAKLRKFGNRVVVVPRHSSCEDNPFEKLPDHVRKRYCPIGVAGVEWALALVQHEKFRYVPSVWD
jgi:hypothetical protein